MCQSFQLLQWYPGHILNPNSQVLEVSGFSSVLNSYFQLRSQHILADLLKIVVFNVIIIFIDYDFIDICNTTCIT